MKIIFLFLFILLFFLLFFLFNKILKIQENFCKIPKYNRQAQINDKKVYLDYAPQSNIKTSSCDQYWKDWPLEYNNTLIEALPNVVFSDQLNLPIEKQFANKQYEAGLIDFDRLASLISEEENKNIFSESVKLLIDPITKKELNFAYELDFAIHMLNKETNINRWKIYNPDKEVYFNYEDIKSPIEEINILNNFFKERCDILQKNLLTETQLIFFGLIKFQIFKYRILYINYLNSDNQKPIYIMEISFYRHSDYYINTFSYVGFIKDNLPFITNVQFVGRNATDTVFSPDAYNDKTLKEKIINTNFTNDSIIEKDPDAIVAITKKYQEQYKLKNQYACFNLNFDPNKKNQYILPYYSLDTCQSNYDRYGNQKEVGVFDTPCKEDKDCPFFNLNKNYENNFGRCKNDGYCELPSNMKRIGYRYFSQKHKPLCYNCLTDKFEIITTLDTCCDEQYNKSKYPFLNTPDFSYDNDSLERRNYFNQKFCKAKLNSWDLNCKEIIL